VTVALPSSLGAADTVVTAFLEEVIRWPWSRWAARADPPAPTPMPIDNAATQTFHVAGRAWWPPSSRLILITNLPSSARLDDGPISHGPMRLPFATTFNHSCARRLLVGLPRTNFRTPSVADERRGGFTCSERKELDDRGDRVASVRHQALQRKGRTICGSEGAGRRVHDRRRRSRSTVRSAPSRSSLAG